MSYAGSAVNALRGVREYMPVIFQGRGRTKPLCGWCLEEGARYNGQLRLYLTKVTRAQDP